MGASFRQTLAGAAALAVGAQAAGATTWAGSAVDAFLHDPAVGPGWATGATSKTGRTSLAKQLASAQDMVRNSGVPPVALKP